MTLTLRSIRWCLQVMLGLAVAAAPSVLRAQEDIGAFQTQLSSLLLGKPSPIPDVEGGFYLGIAIVPPGEAWTPHSGEDDVAERTPWGTSPLALQFNYPVVVNNGIATMKRQQRLDRLWKRILSDSTPMVPIADAFESPILFRQADRIDAARGLENVRQPSEKYLRYQEFQAAWRLLENTRPGDDAWRFHPRFAGSASLEQARAQLADEWVAFGYKTEVEQALKRHEQHLAGGPWKLWLQANSAFHANAVDQLPGVPTGRTWLHPAEGEWHSMRSWTNAVFQGAGSSKINCQLTRVKISRPWFDTTLLTDPRFKLRKDTGLALVSDGAVPTNSTFATGDMANVVVELILVRRIQGAAQGHPLARYEYPEAINLIGYIVRSFPKIKAEDP